MDNQIIEKELKEHESQLILLNNKVKWLEKENHALKKRLNDLKDSDITRMV